MLVSISYKIKIKLFGSIKMLRFRVKKNCERKIWCCKTKNQKKIFWNVDIDNLIIWESIETKTSSTYLIGYFDKVIRPLLLTLVKMCEYVKTFEVKDKKE